MYSYLWDTTLVDRRQEHRAQAHVPRGRRVSFVDLAKHMVDLMLYHYTVGVDELSFRLGSDDLIDKFEVPHVTSVIREVRFFDSMVVFVKDADRTVPVSQHL